MKSIEEDYKLKKILILSRHGLRTPFTKKGAYIEKFTNHKWFDWKEEPSHLTEKGRKLEQNFGKYIREWLIENKFLNKNKDLLKEEIYIRTNTLQRTIATGKALKSRIFPNVEIKVDNKGLNNIDSIFDSVIEMNEKEKDKILSHIHLNKINEELKASYLLLSDLIEYKNSEYYKNIGKCEFFEIKESIKVHEKKLEVTGAIKIATEIIDALLLEYYMGSPIEKLSEDSLENYEKWKKISKIKDKYVDLIYGENGFVPHTIKSMIEFIYNDLERSKHKFTLLVGHDCTIISVFSILVIEDYILENQFEKTPIGGKVFFEMFENSKNEKKIKIEYVYQSFKQIQKEEELSIKNKPYHKILKIKDLECDENGCYKYEDFLLRLKGVTTKK